MRPDELPKSATPPPHVELRKGSEEKFLSQVIDAISDMTRDHVRLGTAAISGPNQLALTFPASYHFSKQYCERPEVHNRLESIASQIAGRPIRISVHVSANEPLRSEKDEQSKPTPDRSAQAPQDDEFLQHALDLFGASLVRVDRRDDEMPTSAE